MNQQIKTILLLGFLTTLLIGFGSVMGPKYFYSFTILAVILNVGSYFFSDSIILKMYRAKEVNATDHPWLHEVVAELAQKAGIPKPKICIIQEETPNAFATGRNPAKGVIAITSGIQKILNRRELRGVLAHEMAHIKNRDTLIATIAAVIATTISYISNIFQWTSLLGGQNNEEKGSPLAGIVMALLAPFIAMLIQFGISRSREYYADSTGALLSGDPEALASALEKLDNFSLQKNHNEEDESLITHSPATSSLFIINPFTKAKGLTSLFSTHPATAERVKRLKALKHETFIIT